MQNSFFKKRLRSFVYAFHGIITTFKTQHNFQIHIVFTIFVLAFSYILNISTFEWIAVIVVIGLVLSAEIFNTAIEEIVNFISHERNIKAGRIKDIAAGGVLVCSIIAFTTGVIIFLPKLLKLI